jgi:hypothetical protein
VHRRILTGRKIALILAFASKTLREICENEEQAEQRFGKKVTEGLKHRLADLEAVSAAPDLVAGRPPHQHLPSVGARRRPSIAKKCWRCINKRWRP